MSKSQTYNFNVNISIDSNNEAIFTYFQNGEQVSGGGTVYERDSLGIYTLDSKTFEQGFVFTGAKFTNIVGTCVEDFNYKVSDDGKAITISDTDENDGSICMIFSVQYNGMEYLSKDPQVINKKEN